MLPIISFSADAIIVIWKFLLWSKSTKSHSEGMAAGESRYEDEFAHWLPFDLSIQFMLWWMPFVVLLGWWTDRPMHLVFGTSCVIRRRVLPTVHESRYGMLMTRRHL